MNSDGIKGTGGAGGVNPLNSDSARPEPEQKIIDLDHSKLNCLKQEHVSGRYLDHIASAKDSDSAMTLRAFQEFDDKDLSKIFSYDDESNPYRAKMNFLTHLPALYEGLAAKRKDELGTQFLKFILPPNNTLLSLRTNVYLMNPKQEDADATEIRLQNLILLTEAQAQVKDALAQSKSYPQMNTLLEKARELQLAYPQEDTLVDLKGKFENWLVDNSRKQTKTFQSLSSNMLANWDSHAQSGLDLAYSLRS